MRQISFHFVFFFNRQSNLNGNQACYVLFDIEIMISYSSDAKVFLIKIIEVFSSFSFVGNSNRDFNAYHEKLNYIRNIE